MENISKEKVVDNINERIKFLSKKSKHYLVDIGTIEDYNKEKKHHKVYHRAGKGRKWCSACERIRELKKLRKEIILIE